MESFFIIFMLYPVGSLGLHYIYLTHIYLSQNN